VRKGFLSLALVCLLFAGGALSALAQDVDSVEVAVLEVREDGILVLDVDGRRMFAVSDTLMRNALKAAADLEAAEGKLASTEALLASSDTAIARYETTLARQREYIVELEDVARGYKDLLQDYKRLRIRRSWSASRSGASASGASCKNPTRGGWWVCRYPSSDSGRSTELDRAQTRTVSHSGPAAGIDPGARRIRTPARACITCASGRSGWRSCVPAEAGSRSTFPPWRRSLHR
jgi:hypothetical protein